MNSQVRHLHRFVRAARRRMILLRGIEGAGMAMVAGCAVALLLMPVLFWRGESALPLAAAVLGISAAAGGVWGVSRRPSLVAAAMEADRQLRLDDLLSTALAVRAGDGRPEVRYVLAMAEARCREISPSHLVLNRLGVRAWGGVGLAAGLVLTIGAISSTAADSRAERMRAGFVTAAEPAELRHTAPAAPGVYRPHQVGLRPDPHRPPSPTRDAGGLSLGERAESEHDQSEGQVSFPSTDSAGEGPGPGRGDAPPTSPPLAASASRDGGEAAQGDEPSAGAGAAALHPADSAEAGGISRPSAAPAAPPWRTQRWNADRAAALESIHSGRVPDASRDLVRAYFDHDTAPDPQR